MQTIKNRYIVPETIDAHRGKHRFKFDLIGTKILRFGQYEIDLRSLEQLTDSSQLRAAFAILLDTLQSYKHKEMSEGNLLKN